MGTRARGHSKRDDVANKGDRRRSHTTRTCTDDVRGHQQKRRSETTAVREALRHRPGQYEVLVPRQWTCSICMSIACRKNSPRVRQRSESNSKLDGCTAAFLDFEKEKKSAPAPAEWPGVWFAAEGAKGGLNPVFFFLTQKPKNPIPPSVRPSNPGAGLRKPGINFPPGM